VLFWLLLGCMLAVGFGCDAAVMAAVHPLHHSRFSDFLDHTVRWLGNGKFQIPALLLTAGLSIAFTRQVRNAIARSAAWALLAFAVSGIAAGIVKAVVGRARPWVVPAHARDWHDHFRGDYQSFPSGDSTTAFAIALTLGSFFPSLRVPLLIIACIVAACRVIVGAHHVSDVVAGAALGIATAQAVTRFARDRARQGASAAA
jgi:membrane-associated phospholipid phosphatase